MADGVHMIGAVTGGAASIGGEVAVARRLTMADLRSLPQHQRSVVFTCRRSGLRSHAFTGPLLLDVASLAAPVFMSAERKWRTRFLLSLRGSDGHRVVLSCAEIDPEFAARPMLLGVTRDGEELDREGPQLVVPGDQCGARNLSGVTELKIFSDPTA